MINFLLGVQIVSVRQVQAGMKVSSAYTLARRYVEKLVQYGILREVTGKGQNRLYRVDEILRALEGPLGTFELADTPPPWGGNKSRLLKS